MPAPWDRRLPNNVFRLAPPHGRVLCGSRNAIARRSAPRRPIQSPINASRSRTPLGNDEDEARANQSYQTTGDYAMRSRHGVREIELILRNHPLSVCMRESPV